MEHAELEMGETYSVVVDRLSNKDNGIIELQGSHINLGPISETAVGKELEFEYLGKGFGRCCTPEFRPSNYEAKLSRLLNPPSSSSSNLSTSEPKNKNKLLRGKL